MRICLHGTTCKACGSPAEPEAYYCARCQRAVNLDRAERKLARDRANLKRWLRKEIR